eukprot:scpid84139/ scgid29607/ 
MESADGVVLDGAVDFGETDCEESPWKDAKFVKWYSFIVDNFSNEDLRTRLYGVLTDIEMKQIIAEAGGDIAKNEMLLQDLISGGWTTFKPFREAVCAVAGESSNYRDLANDLFKIQEGGGSDGHCPGDVDDTQPQSMDVKLDDVKDFSGFVKKLRAIISHPTLEDIAKHIVQDSARTGGDSVAAGKGGGGGGDWRTPLRAFQQRHHMTGLLSVLRYWQAVCEPADCTLLALYRLIHSVDKREAHECRQLLRIPADIS